MRIPAFAAAALLSFGCLAFWQSAVAPKKLLIIGAVAGSDNDIMNPGFGGNAFTFDEVSGPNREVVDYPTDLPPGSIVVKTRQRKLYYIQDGGKAISYRVGVGREGFSWSGSNVVSRKAEWPDWRPPSEMIKREAEQGHIIPAFMPGGPKNPLGARALYIGDTDYRIHGTDKPWSIGHAVSSGCIRMLNEHVAELYDLVKVGAKVVVE